ncbi:MAG TPA: hypothetical protein VGF36_04650 [Rhodopila sp.]
MAKNKFEQVDDVQPDAITLSLAKDGDRPTGTVILPASASNGRLSQDQVSGRLSATDAFRAAIRLANDMKVAIVVMDPQGAWNTEWGELFREGEAAD